jgi:hypothetical protein
MTYVPDPSINFSKPSSTSQAEAAEPAEEDWQRLEASFLTEYPVCPDCGAGWDFGLANKEIGWHLDGTTELVLMISCPAYEADEEAGREPAFRRVAADGFLTHELVLA